MSRNPNPPHHARSSTWIPPLISTEFPLFPNEGSSAAFPANDTQPVTPLASPGAFQPISQHVALLSPRSTSLFSDLDPFSKAPSTRPLSASLNPKLSSTAPFSNNPFAPSAIPLDTVQHKPVRPPLTPTTAPNATFNPFTTHSTVQSGQSVVHHDLSFFEKPHPSPVQVVQFDSRLNLLGEEETPSTSHQAPSPPPPPIRNSVPAPNKMPISIPNPAPASNKIPVPSLNSFTAPTKTPVPDRFSFPNPTPAPPSNIVPLPNLNPSLTSAHAPAPPLNPSPAPARATAWTQIPGPGLASHVSAVPTPAPSIPAAMASRPPTHSTQVQEPAKVPPIKSMAPGKNIYFHQRMPDLNVDSYRMPSRSVSETSSDSLQKYSGPLDSSMSDSFRGNSIQKRGLLAGETKDTTPPRMPRDLYKPRSRGPVHLERPVAIEIRPKPRKIEYGADNKGRAMVCSNNCIYMVSDDGIRAWDLDHAINGGSDGCENLAEDCDAAAVELISVREPRVQCIVVDDVEGVMWTGHVDGTVKCWQVKWEAGVVDTGSEHIFEWMAHRNTVSAMTITPYGELWTGSESGEMKAWPCRPLFALLEGVSRAVPVTAHRIDASCIDLKGWVSQGSSVVPGNLHSEVRFMVADRAHSRVWSGGKHNVVIWDAQSREVLKTVGPYLHSELSGVRAPMASSLAQKEPKDKNVASVIVQSSESDERSGKKFWKSLQSAVGGAGRAVEAAVGGAADKVRRAAQRVESAKKLSAICTADDGSVWAGFESGLLLQWNVHGSTLQEHQPSSIPIRSICCVGSKVWVGYADRKVVVYNGMNGKKIGQWEAHKMGIVLQLAVCGNHVVSLSSHGGLRAWSVNSPGPLDAELRNSMAALAQQYTLIKPVRFGAWTWNVGEERPSKEALLMWLGRMTDRDVIAIGLQEMEVGAGTIAIAAAKESVGLEKGSTSALWWLSNVDDITKDHFHRVAERQLAGMLIAVWVRKEYMRYIDDVRCGAVACGFGRALGNKGAVGIQLSLFRRTFCFLNSHFAAHQENVSKRNQDWMRIYHRMTFGESMGAVASSVVKVAANVGAAFDGIVKVAHTRKTFNRMTPMDGGSDLEDADADSSAQEEPLAADPRSLALAEADFLVWMGDFNYRLNASFPDEILPLIMAREFPLLLEKDQLRQQKAEGLTFVGMKEASIEFQPTYKFDRRKVGNMAYDSSEKRRIPAWCDRVLYRDSFEEHETSDTKDASLYKPLKATVVSYGSCMDVLDSDHKPVHCLLDIKVAIVDEAKRRRLHGQVYLDSLKNQSRKEKLSAPATVLNPAHVLLDGKLGKQLTLTNTSKSTEGFFTIMVDVHTKESSRCICGRPLHVNVDKPRKQAGGFPSWLRVEPAAGTLSPLETKSIEVKFVDLNHSHKGNWREEESREKSVVLLMEVKGHNWKDSYKRSICVHHGDATLRMIREMARLQLNLSTM